MNRKMNLLLNVAGGLFAMGIFASAAMAGLIAYEGFDFAGGPINGNGSGFGFSGNWINTSSPFLNVSSDNVSLDSPTFPFDPVGNRVESTGGATRRLLENTYDLNQDGAPVLPELPPEEIGCRRYLRHERRSCPVAGDLRRDHAGRKLQQ